MDKKTFIQFIMISIMVIVGWNMLNRAFGPAAPPPEREEEPIDEVDPPAVEEEEVEEPEVVEREVDDEIELGNERIATQWSNRGAGLRSLRLLDYRAPYYEEMDDGPPRRPTLELLREIQDGLYSDVIESIVFITETPEGRSSRTVRLDNHVYEVESRSAERIVFRTEVAGKLEIRKTVSIEPQDYHYTARLQFSNLTEEDFEFEYRLRTAAGIERELLQTRYLASAVAVRGGRNMDIDLTVPDDIEDDQFNRSTNIAWAGMVSQYFVAMLWPDSPEWIRKVESRRITESGIAEGTGRWRELRNEEGGPGDLSSLARDNPNATNVIYTHSATIPAGGSLEDRTYKFVAVPILKEALDAYAPGLASDLRAGRMPFFTVILSLGTIGILAPVMVWILDVFHLIIPNYGVAIILLTLLIRGALHPLTRSSQMSMHKMKKLQPKLQELMQKHGEDRQTMAQEQWKLYSKYGVHPLKGCFPMLLQMPVFLALFKTLRTSVQLRQAVFIPGWITDLSRPDTVWQMPFSIPVLGNDLNILPFIMVGAWMLNQQLTPTPADPKAQQQQKIMKWLPVLFAFMFYNFASGLLLYITCSSAVGAVEHWLIRKKAAGIELTPVDRGKKSSSRSTKGTSGRRTEGGHNKKRDKKGWLQRLVDAEETRKTNSQKLQSSKKRKQNKK